MESPIKLLDVLALTQNRPDYGLVRGQVGTVVEILTPTMFEVEFSDIEGQTYAELAVQESELIVLYHQPVSTG